MKSFVFVHVPKCGGLTFIRNINILYPGKNFDDVSFKRYRRWGMVRYSQYRKVRQYYPSSFLKGKEYKMVSGHFIMTKWKHLGLPIVSIIRNPIERVISNYCVWRIIGRKGHFREIKETWGIRRYAEYTSNCISSMLGDKLDPFLFIGIQEEYTKSIREIGKLLGIPFPNDVGIYNKTPKKIEVSEEDRSYIESVNQEDMILYKNVIRKFHEN